MSINIIASNIKPIGKLTTGNRPLFIIFYDTQDRKNPDIYDIDKEDKYENSKSMFGGHYFIQKNGVIVRGREDNIYGDFSKDDNSNFNINSLGIQVEGNFDNSLINSQQKNSIITLIKHLLDKYPIRDVYTLKELNSNFKTPGLFFPINEIIDESSDKLVSKFRTIPNGNIIYTFGGRKIFYDPKNNMQGNDIIELQTLLNLLGYKCSISGIFSLETKDKLIGFQKYYNLIPDGIMDEDDYISIKKISLEYFKNDKTFNRVLYFESNPKFILFGEDIKLLQNRLNLLGYKCPISGIYDNETMDKVSEFQRNHSLTIDGKVGPITWEFITNSDYNIIRRTIEYKTPMMYGDDIKLIQNRLIELGYTDHIENIGWYDEYTKDLVMNFQKNKNIKKTGIIDNNTSKLLFK
ncbi:N-acetylmuramoyl-L-alanine amidase [Bacillus phage vB_BpuM-BpSp]|nr:N-acetylmuramoyl-L-alanine amidase [Bacillus phage vB_BpuM-BpSp]